MTWFRTITCAKGMKNRNGDNLRGVSKARRRMARFGTATKIVLRNSLSMFDSTKFVLRVIDICLFVWHADMLVMQPFFHI